MENKDKKGWKNPLADLIYDWAEGKYNYDILKPTQDTSENYLKVESFIEQLLLTQRKELRDRIEKLRCTEPERIEAGMDIYNKALDSVLTLLEEK